ncbi:MAG: PD-(D/E)XK nuclease family protein [Bacilli bacterium]|nr:PD-(D/E)XK nuclease family protein [Bacilli bacterium]
MEIVTENGKDYLVTYIAKIDNNTIDANSLFADAQEAVSKILKAYNTKHKTKNLAIYSGYGSNLQSLVNRYSGDYFSPSFMKGYQTNPALNLVQNFFTEQANDATAIGTAFHKVLEDYYNLPGEERVRDRLWDLEPAALREGMDKALLDEYITGYYDIKDYLHPRSELDEKNLKCVTEHRGRANIHVKRLGYTLPCAVSYVADRIDYRGDDVVILDYKTGHPTDDSVTFDGYLGSMILYKWAMEQELNIEITKGYLICPGNTASKKYLALDYSLENEKKMMEKIERFYKGFMRDNRSREYEFTDVGYFTSEDAKKYKAIMNDNTIWMSKIPIKVYIGEHNESCL